MLTFARRVRNGLVWRYARYKLLTETVIKSYAALIQSRIDWYKWRSSAPHGLPGELIISLTSYRPRFDTLHHTLRCLFSQTIKADRVILWVTAEDGPLPSAVTDFRAHGLEVRLADEIKSFKKIIPTLEAFPDAFIVTADDDAYYPPNWLAELVRAWNGDHRQIVCRVARRVVAPSNGAPPSYNDWDYVEGQAAGPSILPVGIGGVLYPPGALPPETTDRPTFMRLCPRADDLWLYWMGQRAGATYKKIGERKFPQANWPGSQKAALFHDNALSGGNDVQIQALVAFYGWPTPVMREEAA